ncbi:MAG: hypothetical protein J7501_13675 [Bdellovibrio sp.]|nr:hypothetical protein [Bdellovibrio sp.]
MEKNDFHISQITTRTHRPPGRKFWITANSMRLDGLSKWSNCLYLHFVKEDFPQIDSPKLVAQLWAGGKQCFEYSKSVLNQLDFHGGITFYEEIKSIETGRTIVKVGCDYQHIYDDHYMTADHGEKILRVDGMTLIEQFEELGRKLEKVRGE